MTSELRNGEAARQAIPTDQPRRRLGHLPVVAIGLAALVAAVAVWWAANARRIPELTQQQLTSAIDRWEARGPESYDLDIRIEGLRAGRVHVEVRNDVVTAMTRDGDTPQQRRTWDVWSVPGMFDTIERELELAEDPEVEMQASRGTRLWLRCEFDPELGFPRRFHRAVMGGGPEVYWQVISFSPR